MRYKAVITDEMKLARKSGICMLTNCDRPYFSTGKCKTHYGKRWYADNPEATVHLNMKARCYRKNAPEYKNYGARGITVCERWRHGEDGKSGFRCFVDDMGKRPSPKHEIDRINPLGNYEPTNCRWVTENVQSINTRAIHTNNTSGYKGVNYCRGSWYATLKVNKEYYHSSYLDTKEEAIAYRKMLEVKYHKPLLIGASK